MKPTNKRAVASFQLITLVAAVFAFSFIIYSSTASASTISYPSVCCEKTTEGGWCINTNDKNCDKGFKQSPTSCESTSYCKQGTCYDSQSGICMENTPQRVCNEEGGTWDAREIEELPQCQSGCCIIADQAAFVSLVRCKRLSSLFGVENDYRKDITNEIDCIAEAQSQDVGACVFEQDYDRTCKFTTRKDCGARQVVEIANGTNVSISSEKRFYKNYLCSAEELVTSCARQAETGCYQGKVYWFDSCGNRENVYSIDKDASWNNGRIAEPSEICPANGGGDKGCGNCDYFLGTRCAEWEGVLGIGKPAESDYYCKKTECVDRKGEKRKNGESWCVYDASVGAGTDPAGSRHYKEVCVDGEVRVEACADFRQQVCIQGSISTSGGEFKTAACRVNRWQDCAAQTEKDNCENIDKRDCIWTEPLTGLVLGGANSGDSFTNPSSGQTFTNPMTGQAIFGGDEDKKEEEKTTTNRPNGVCVPDIPPGLKFWEDGEAKGICGVASLKCIVTIEKSTFGGEKCVENCECLEEDWALHANQVCRSLGDCGGYINYVGKYTDDGYEWIEDGGNKEFSPNSVNQIVISGRDEGSKSKGLSFGAVAGGLAGIGLVAGIWDPSWLGGVKSTSLIPNIAEGLLGMIPKGGGKGIVSSLGMNKNWLAAGAWNALIVGAIVWGGAKLFGADKNTANALGAATSIGLFAGEAAGQLAMKYGVKTIESFGTIATSSSTSGTIPLQIGQNIIGQKGSFPGWEGVVENGIGTLTTTTAEGAKVTAIAEGGKITSLTQQSWLGANAGLVNLGVTIGVAILVYYLMKKDYETKVVTFNCMAWQAPNGGNDCEKCNDADLACSEYRCKSLGQACELVNPGTADEKCVYVNPRDTNPPIISPNENELSYDYEYKDVKISPPGPGFKIVRDGDNECVEAFTPLKFGVDTNEPAQCKIDIKHTTKFDEMAYWFGGSNLYLYNHTEQLSLPGPSAFENSSIILENGKDMNLFIRCKDKNGNENSAEYAVKFCVDDSPDNTAPQIKATSVNNGGCIAEDTDKANVDFYVDEPADCRWSHEDKDYDNMGNSMTCSSELYAVNSLQLYTCKAELTGISRDETQFYVRCKDQPSKPEEERNKNKQSYEFSLKGSTALKMKNLQPNGTIYGAVDPAPVELYTETLFGCDAGKSICYYSTTGKENDYIMFFDTNTDDGIHTQRQDLGSGVHTYYYKCVDSGGNVARNSTTFDLEIDVNAPVVARVYEEDDMLKIVTVRNSECAYSFDGCDFLFEEGVEMPYAKSKVHVTDWQKDKAYYIKCRDEFKNEEADCSVIVRAVQNFL